MIPSWYFPQTAKLSKERIQMSNNRLEYVDQQYREMREKHDTAMKIGDFFAIRDLQNAYNHLAKERNWLHDIDQELFFPHEWRDWEKNGLDIRVTITWDDMRVKTPLDNRTIERGGFWFPYNFRFSFDDPRMGQNLALLFMKQTGLNQLLIAGGEAENIIKWYAKDAPAYPQLVKQLPGTPLDELDKIALQWLNDDADMIDSLNYCRERARSRGVWPEACRLAFRAIATGNERVEWDFRAEDVFEVIER
jgi:hypothetical protein